jgi:adenylate cyclase
MTMNPYKHAAQYTWQTIKKLGPWSVVWVTITALLLITLKIYNPAPVESLRLKGFDLLLSSDPEVLSEQVVLVDLGEKSMERLGQWPWPRQELAHIVDRLRELKAAVVVMPVIMSERDRLKGDADLAKSLARVPSVIAQAPTNQNKKPDAVRRGVAVIGGDPYTYLFTWPGALAPVPELAQSAGGVGTAAVAPEMDGVVRRMPLIVNVAKEYYPNVTLEALRVYTGEKSYQVKMNDSGVEKVRVAGQPIIDTDANARVWLRWSKTFQRIEATDLAKRDIDLKNKIVVIGITAEGLGGIIATPRGEMWAHDLQAISLQTMLDGNSPSRPWWSDAAEIGLILLITAMVIALMPRLPIWGMALLLVGTVWIVIETGLRLWMHWSFLFDIYFVVAAAVVIYGHGLFVRFAREFLQKQQIKKQFGTYLSPALVAKLQKNPELLQLGGDERELSIMFTDVRGFTTISEHYGTDVQGLTKIMNRYMTAMTAKIIGNNGTLDKYIGDAQMAFWNAPVEESRHAHQAVKTALEMLGDLDAFNEEISKEGIPAFGMGLGINTATVVVGNMGSDQRFDYTCLGDGVNLASRLEGQSKGYGVRIILGQRTAELVKDEYPVIELDNIAVKGKNIGVKIFTVGETIKYKHENYLNFYYRGDWTRARKMAQELAISPEVNIQDYYHKMIERIDEGLPANWDGTWRATSK